MFEPRRLHPVAILLMIIKSIKDLVLPVIVVVVLPSRNDGIPGWVQPLVLGVVLLILLVYSFLQWWRFTYRIESGEFRMESGVFVKKKRYIKFDRIHSINISEGIIQRLFGLVKVNIETAGGNQADAILTAIKKHEAEQLNERILEEKKKKSTQTPEDTLQVEAISEPLPEKTAAVYTQSIPQLILMAATSGAIGVFLSGGIAFISQFDDIIPFERIFKNYEAYIRMSTIILTLFAIIALAVVYALATISMVIKYANFTVQKTGEELIISRGLLEKRQLTIPVHKIQGIRIMENLVRRPLGLATVYLEYAGGSMEDKESLTIMLFPLIRKKRLSAEIQNFMPDYLMPTEIKPVPKRAYMRFLYRKAYFIIPIIAVLIWLFHLWGLLSLLLIPLAAIWSYFQMREIGWDIKGDLLMISSCFLSKQTLIMKKNRIQSITVKKSYFQEQKRLATVKASIKSGISAREGTAVDIEAGDSEQIKAWFIPK